MTSIPPVGPGPVGDLKANTSAPTSATRTVPHATAAVRISSRRNIHSMLELDPESMDPGRHYRFVRRDSLAITKARLKGYSTELQREGGPRLLGDTQPDGAADGSINVGDTVLMSCPEELYQEGRQELYDLNEANLQAVQAETEEKIKAAGRQIPGNKGRQAIRVITDKE